MNDRPITSAPPDGPDPVVAAALRTMKPPPHGSAFWDDLEARLAAEPAPTATVPVVPPAAPPLGPPPPLAPEPPPLAPEPPLAEVVPLAGRRSRPAPWWAASAAALVAALGLAAVLRSGDTTVETSPAASSTVPSLEETTSVPEDPGPTDSTAPTKSTATTATTEPATSPASSVKPGVGSSVTRSPSTTSRASLTLTPTGLGPLRLGMTIQQARATGAVGPYSETRPGCGFADPAGPYRVGDFGALFLNGRLARILPASTRVRTPQGVGNGSRAAELDKVPGLRGEGPSEHGSGIDVEITTGDTGYKFTVKNGVVTQWSAGTRTGLELRQGCS